MPAMQTGTLLIDSALYDSCCSFWDAFVAEGCRCARRRRPLHRPAAPRDASAPAPAPAPAACRGGGRGGGCCAVRRARARAASASAPPPEPATGAARVRRSASAPDAQPRCRRRQRHLPPPPSVRRHAAAVSDRDAISAFAAANATHAITTAPATTTAAPEDAGGEVGVGAGAGGASAQGDEAPPPPPGWTLVYGNPVRPSAPPPYTPPPTEFVDSLQAFTVPSQVASWLPAGEWNSEYLALQTAPCGWTQPGNGYYNPLGSLPLPCCYYLPYWPPAAPFQSCLLLSDFLPPLAADGDGAEVAGEGGEGDGMAELGAAGLLFGGDAGVLGGAEGGVDGEGEGDVEGGVGVGVGMGVGGKGVGQDGDGDARAGAAASVSFRIAHLAELLREPFKKQLFLELADGGRAHAERFEVVTLRGRPAASAAPPLRVDCTLAHYLVQADVLDKFLRRLPDTKQHGGGGGAGAGAGGPVLDGGPDDGLPHGLADGVLGGGGVPADATDDGHCEFLWYQQHGVAPPGRAAGPAAAPAPTAAPRDCRYFYAAAATADDDAYAFDPSKAAPRDVWLSH